MNNAATLVPPKDGMLLVNKPTGMTSKDVSRWLQKRFGKLKIGHVGTLDPLAEGVLPILFGKATRVQDFLLGGQKAYEFDVQFGFATDSLDLDGQIVARAPWEHLSFDGLNEICLSLEGNQEQTPPLYSAVKFHGKPLYEYARKGLQDLVPLEKLGKPITINKLECVRYEAGIGTFRVLCSKGTYVRVIGAQIAEQAQTLGTIIRLVRTSSGSFHISKSWSLEDISENLDRIQDLVVPLHALELGIPTWVVSDLDRERRLKMGQIVELGEQIFLESLKSSQTFEHPLRSLDHVVLIDKNGKAFGIGTASSDTIGQIAVRMRRGLS